MLLLQSDAPPHPVQSTVIISRSHLSTAHQLSTYTIPLHPAFLRYLGKLLSSSDAACPIRNDEPRNQLYVRFFLLYHFLPSTLVAAFAAPCYIASNLATVSMLRKKLDAHKRQPPSTPAIELMASSYRSCASPFC